MRPPRRAAARLALAAALGLAPACAFLRPAPAPLKRVEYRSGRPAEVLVVLLPGRRGGMEDFAKADFPALARAAGATVDLVAVDAHMGYYVRRTVVQRLLEDVVVPARAAGYRRIWLVGASLGGTGALLFASQHPGEVDGIVALAPYLGGGKLVREIDAAGPAAWRPRPGAEDFPADLWTWLQERAARPGPEVYLGYGEGDDFAEANRLAASLLPPGHTLTADGGHDWTTWAGLWERFLRLGVLQGQAAPAGRGVPAPSAPRPPTPQALVPATR